LRRLAVASLREICSMLLLAPLIVRRAEEAPTLRRSSRPVRLGAQKWAEKAPNPGPKIPPKTAPKLGSQ
jgi:hypothetical protein